MPKNVSALTRSLYVAESKFAEYHAPSLRLDELADLDHPTSPASVLRRALPKLIEARAPSSESLDRLAKTFGAELADAATSAARAMRSRIKNLSSDMQIFVDEFITRVAELYSPA